VTAAEKAESAGRAWLEAGQTVEDVLARWRADGLSILDSIRSLSHIADLSLGDAKQVVHRSQAWSDLRTAHDRVHKELERIASAAGNDDGR
jgi:hypothetical protein